MANKVSNVNTLQLDGYTMTPDTTEVTVLMRDPNGYIMLASDTDVPSAEAGYAVGCRFIDTDASGVSNIFLVNEGDATSCSFVTATAATSFNALTDTNLNPATGTAGTVPCIVGGVLTAKAGLVFGTATPTSGNVLVGGGTTWGTATPDTAGLVAKAGNQTGIAGNKTWTGDHIFSGTVTYSGTLSIAGVSLTDDSTVASTKYIYFGDTDSYVYSPSAGELTIKAKTTAAGTLTLDGYDMSIGASGVGGITIGQTTGAGGLTLNFGTDGLTVEGVAASTVTIGKSDQTGDILLGQSSANNEVKIATGNGNKTLTMVTGTGTNTVNLCTSTGTDTISIGTGAAAKVITIGSATGASSLSLLMGTGNFSLAGANASTITIGAAAQSGKISIGDSTGTLTIDVGVGGSAVKTVNIANEAGQAHVIAIGGAASTVTVGGATLGFGSAGSEAAVTVGNMTGASSLALYAGTGNITMSGVAATTITIGAAAQTGTMKFGESTGALQIDIGTGGSAVKTVNIANENAQVHVIGIGGTNSLPTITGTTVTVAAGTLFDVNGSMDVSDTLTAVDVEASGMVVADYLSQAKMYWCDDFAEAGAVLASTVYSKAHWTGGGTNGTQTVTAAPGGTMVLSTTATGSRSASLTYSGANTFDNDLAWVFEARIKTSNITNTKIDLGMYLDANDEIIFRFDTDVDAANIYLVTENDNAGEVVTDTTIDLTANTYFTFRIEAYADDSFEVYINGSEVLASHPSNTIRDVLFVPYFYVDNKAAAEQKDLSIDYCKVWQDRAST